MDDESSPDVALLKSPEVELGDDAEVVAAATKRSVEIGMIVRACGYYATVCKDDLGL